MKLRNNIQTLLDEKNMERAELAELMGVHKQTVRQWCTNRNNPAQKYHQKLCEVLGCEERSLFVMV